MATSAARHARSIIRNSEHVIALELMAAAQAIDLRLHTDPKIKLGQRTAKAHAKIRQEVS